MPPPPSLDALEPALRPPPALPALDGYTFEGYRNPDGSVGTRNILAITTSVQCVAGTLDFAVKRIKAELLPQYPNVDDVVGLTHSYGCGVAIDAPMAIVPIRTLRNISQNPNFGGEVMVVGLGCEKLQPERLLPPGVSSGVMRMQDESLRGFAADRSTPSWRWPRRASPCSTGAGARPARRPTWSLACNAAAATRFPASPPIRRSASPPTCWCAPARP